MDHKDNYPSQKSAVNKIYVLYAGISLLYIVYPLLLFIASYIYLFDDLSMFPPIHNSISINAPVSRIWAMLTDPVLMKAWMSEMDLDIDTDWNVGSPVVITGTIYKKPFFNKGTVLSYLPEQELAYTHLSSLSRLPDVPESYTKLSFKLSSDTDGTILDIHIENFPTEAIYRHLQFYWNVVPHILKRIAEQ